MSNKKQQTDAARRGAHMRDTQHTSWDDHQDYLEYHRDGKARRRRAVIERLAPGLRCPDCGKTKTKLRQWTLLPGKDLATCLSCYRKHYVSSTGRRRRVPLDEPAQVQGPLVIREMIYYVVDGTKVRDARKKAGLSATEFRKQTGWTRSFQTNVEDGSVILNRSQVNCIVQTLEKFGVTFV